WVLCDGADMGPILLCDVFRFMPAALLQVRFTADRTAMESCVIEGALGLGQASDPQPHDARARVRLELAASAKGDLVIRGIRVVPADSTLEWELDESLELLGVR